VKKTHRLRQRTRLKKKSKQKISTIQIKIWEICKELVRRRDGNVCIVCGKTGLEGSGWHTGHFIPRSTCGAFLRYNLRNLHSSCYNCNINLGGNGAMFLVALEGRYGREFVNKILQDKQRTTKADIIFYENEKERFIKMQSWSKDELFDYTKSSR